ncbi:hypothetical protein FOPG_13756 [Fusarium oxysporum f. sp. conglutinans race 2 54008]|uniref:Uncharacterized protein n=1 Tax=Fusarium oxysporum f. sp. conglutinans race 2 54008 TaxID=1089457 RepID=X0IB40_FUSOX|nr:hypothetical protein FOPG_13756 [Fusarium oxysporum f. sp. conglutinans race 2 54008]
MSSEWKPDYRKEDDGAPVYDQKEEQPGPAYEDNSAEVVFEGGSDSGMDPRLSWGAWKSE